MQERENRILGSPEHRRTPQAQHNLPPIPFQLNIPPGYIAPLPALQHDPFQVVNHNGQALTLTQHTAMALNSLPPLIPLRQRGRGRGASTPSTSTVSSLSGC